MGTFTRLSGAASLAVCLLACGGTTPAADASMAPDTSTPVEDAGADAAMAVDANVDAGPPPVGCPLAFSRCTTFEDRTADTTLTIAVTGADPNFAYSPHCIRIRAGTVVSIPGSAAHPLVGALCSPTGSPLPASRTVTDADYTFTAPGAYGYYCHFHGTNAGAGMAGLIVVE